MKENPLTRSDAGIHAALAAAFLYSVATGMAKFALADFHLLQVLFFRQIVVLLASSPTILRSLPQMCHPDRPRLQMLRLIAGFCALSLSLWAVAKLPLATATVLMFTQVFFAILIGKWVLKEQVSLARLVLVGFGFLGVVIVLNPQGNSFANVFVLVPMAAALSAAIAGASVRHLSQTNSTGLLLAYQALFVGVLSGISMFWLWKTPDLQQLIFLFSIGVFSTIGQWLGVRALRLADISLIAGVENTKLIYAVLIGLLVFGEMPDAREMVGSLIIAIAAYMSVVKRR